MTPRKVELLLSELIDEGSVVCTVDSEGNRVYSAAEGNSLYGLTLLMEEAKASVALDKGDGETQVIG